MPTLKIADMFYQRQYADMPEMVLINRFLEGDPTNNIEGTSLLARPGTNPLITDTLPAAIRSSWSMPGQFGGDLFLVSSTSLYRFGPALGDGSNVLTQITGTLVNNGFVKWAPQWGGGAGTPIYQNLFISDGSSLQYYPGPAFATGTLTAASGGSEITNQVIHIGSTYFTWGDSTAVLDATANGSSSHPWVALLDDTSVGGSTSDDNSLGAMANLIMFIGVPGVNFSIGLAAANTQVSATHTLGTLTLNIASLVDTSAGDSIGTVVTSGSNISFGASTLAGGGVHALITVPMPNNVAPNALCAVSSYVLVSVANSQIFYYINPGEQTIDPLNFNAKQSAPDNIVDMVAVGDQAVLIGQFSTENWYASGNANDAFAPYEGRVYMRGGREGTGVLVKDSLVLVGNDGVVYSIGYQFGTTAQWGVNRISTHGIEERIRTYFRSVEGLTP